MLLMSERVSPCRARLSRSLSGRVTLIALPSDSTFMAGCQTNSRFPLGPLTLILPASTLTVTPVGIVTSCLPIRDIVHLSSWCGRLACTHACRRAACTTESPNVTEQFAAEPFRAGLAIAHDAA